MNGMILNIRQWLIHLNRVQKLLLQCFADLLTITLSALIAFWTVSALAVPLTNPSVIFGILFNAIISLSVFYFLGLYQNLIRYFTPKIFLDILFGAAISSLVLYCSLIPFTLISAEKFVLIYGLCLLVLQASSRLFAQQLFSGLKTGFPKKNVAIFGAAEAGRQLHGAMKLTEMYTVVCFVDDNPNLKSAKIQGTRVVDTQQALKMLPSCNCDLLLFAERNAATSLKRDIIDKFHGIDVNVMAVPNLEDIMSGIGVESAFEPFRIDELLGRDPIEPLPHLMEKNVTGKVVMVTGAGGTIGSEICKQVLAARPTKLILVEASEFGLYEVDMHLLSINTPHQVDIKPFLGSIQDRPFLEDIFKAHKVDTIFHAAAFKHVPLVEANIFSAINNNVFGTTLLCEIAVLNRVTSFTLISTDKAVRPTNVMGATKRLAELICQSYAAKQQKTQFSSVRFGNVIGSSGSVVPLFQKQIKKRKPITITHRDIKRYFMATSEASQLVIQASAMATGHGEVFVLDMGQPIKIFDLALKMLRLSGLRPSIEGTPNERAGDVQITFTGLRPGEKMYEELFIGSETELTEHPRIMKANETSMAEEELRACLDALKDAERRGDCEEVYRQIANPTIGYRAPS
jgi:FlaA1/EpsC-like NDP-sugar epimerase